MFNYYAIRNTNILNCVANSQAFPCQSDKCPDFEIFFDKHENEATSN